MTIEFDTADGPMVNPDINEIADRAKAAYARITVTLAAMQYRTAELAGTGRLDPEEAAAMQDHLHEMWSDLYWGTVCAVRDWGTDDDTWDWADNTYSDGRTVMSQAEVEPAPTTDDHWEHNRYMLGDGAPMEHPLGTICTIAPLPSVHGYAGSEVMTADFRRRLRREGMPPVLRHQSDGTVWAIGGGSRNRQLVNGRTGGECRYCHADIRPGPDRYSDHLPGCLAGRLQ